MAETFHRRPLPPQLVALSADEGRRLFSEALAAGTMQGYFAVAEQFQTQAEPAYCGLTSLAVALNSLGIDPGRAWKGPWRWFSEEMLDCCVGLDEVRARGITLDELGCLARCNGARAEVWRGDAYGEDALREAIERVSRDDDGARLLVSYARGALDQTGDGHFSPVAGFHAASDRALVLDVARFKYPPHWVPVRALHAATRVIDPATGRSRGWITLGRASQVTAFTMRVRTDRMSWTVLSERVAAGCDAVAAVVAAAVAAGREPALAELAQAWLSGIRTLAAAIGFRDLPDPGLAAQRDALRAEMLAGRAGALVATIAPALGLDEAVAALLLLSAPAPALAAAGPAQAGWRALRDDLSPALRGELDLLDGQLAHVLAAGISCCPPAA